ncbi:MAG TPA: metalloregulator ArsR/SmtB family transcription factor [Pyrinomonadaceae bacterium]|jgi:DNA-binding transcriptional ArsR family regulator|nr:metalloregulator ArsR/SmtB family transcription factor [Pyrinomonadaceae bacterium]
MASTNLRPKTAERQLDLVLGAISDKTRRALIARLARGPGMITELAEPFKMSLPAVSKHLRVLEDARLVERSVSGRVHRFSLTPEALRTVEQWLGSYRPFWEDNLDRLERYAQKKKGTKIP